MNMVSTKSPACPSSCSSWSSLTTCSTPSTPPSFSSQSSIINRPSTPNTRKSIVPRRLFSESEDEEDDIFAFYKVPSPLTDYTSSLSGSASPRSECTSPLSGYTSPLCNDLSSPSSTPPFKGLTQAPHRAQRPSDHLYEDGEKVYSVAINQMPSTPISRRASKINPIELPTARRTLFAKE